MAKMSLKRACFSRKMSLEEGLREIAESAMKEFVRQQWNFSPAGSTSETADYQGSPSGIRQARKRRIRKFLWAGCSQTTVCDPSESLFISRRETVSLVERSQGTFHLFGLSKWEPNYYLSSATVSGALCARSSIRPRSRRSPSRIVSG